MKTLSMTEAINSEVKAFFAVIVGSGFSGLCMAIKLKQAGHSFCLLEQADSIGGTWRDNTYPGAACDVPSNLYCFSFAANPNWSRTYPQQTEIQAYMNACADRFDVRQYMQFKQRVSSASFDEKTRLWEIKTNDGQQVFYARSLIVGTGGLSRPQMPDIEGLADFKGPIFHTARWNHEVSLKGKRVALIGTGASAIQVVPAIADQVSELTIFQRTPPWIVFKPDFAIQKWHRWLRKKIPWMQKINRTFVYCWHEAWAIAFTRFPRILKQVQQFSKLFIWFHVRDADLRRKLTPNYIIGCKRVLLSNHYLASLNRSKVRLITESICKITSSGIVTSDGNEHAFDILIACTGFQAAEAGVPFPVHGLQERELNTHWQSGGGASAYLGTTVSGFPNLFIMSGPNTALGHNSMIYIIESQANYVMSAMHQLAKRPQHAFDIDSEQQRNYNQQLQQRLAGTVWNTGGCSSWYLASNGLNTTLWPDFTFVFRRKTRHFDLQNYHILGDEK
jgi:cation diffusion facilitator CzcD-associated flavoprotein CzcO